MNQLKFSLAVLLLAAFSFSLSAQEQPLAEQGCGISIKSDWLTKYQAGDIPRAEKSLVTEYIPMRLVIVGETDGSGYVDPLKVLKTFQVLNEDFANSNIQFYLTSIDYLNKTSLYNHSTTSTGSNLAFRENQPNVINTYIVGTAGGACGYATPRTNYLIMDKDCMGTIDRTWSHEMGHVFTLAHTFYGWEGVGEISNIELTERAPNTVRYRGEDIPVERVDSSNCATAADGFCDTSPDYLMERWACTFDGIYRDSLTDPDSTRFAVNAGNIMSYVSDNCLGEDGFSDEQEMAMITNLAARNDFRSNTSGAGAVAANGEDMNLLLPENNATLENSDYVELHWNAVPNADFYIVQINTSTNFNGGVFNTYTTTDTTYTIEEDLTPNRRYFWRVRPVNRYLVESDFGEQTFRFRNGEFPVATIDAGLNAAITVAPNPVFGGQDLRINGQDLGENGTLTYALIDPAGRTMISRENIRVNASGFNERLQTSTLAAGVYFLRIQLNGKLVTRRVMVTP